MQKDCIVGFLADFEYDRLANPRRDRKIDYNILQLSNRFED
ncbi:MAG: hypothetical protein WBA13_07385 [Microcoleaceae cyanobacterium]